MCYYVSQQFVFSQIANTTCGGNMKNICNLYSNVLLLLVLELLSDDVV